MFVLLGCSRQDVPLLIDVSGVSPRAIEPGDDIDVTGSGFPEGKAATVTLAGTLNRAGLRNVSDFRATFPARGQGRGELSFNVGSELQGALFEGDQGTHHATFQGSVEVAFAPKVVGAPPVLGRLDEVTIEIFSSREAGGQAALAAQRAERLLALLGAQLQPSELGLQVTGVVPRGRAAQAGLLTGDTLLRANGVTLFSVGDLMPSEQQRQISVIARRGETVLPTAVTLSVDGFSPMLPSGFTWAFGAVLAVALWIVLLFLPSGLRPLAVASAAGRSGWEPGGGTRSLVWIAGGCASTLTVLSKPVLGGLTLLVPLVAIALLRPLLGFVSLGSDGSRGFRLRRASVGAFKIQLVELLCVLSLAPVLLHTGGLGPLELRAVQGPLPWQWLAFQSVSGTVAALVYLSSALIDVSGGLSERRIGAATRPRRLVRSVARADAVLVGLKLALFVPLFVAGGARLFGWDAAVSRQQWLLLLVIDLAKYALLVWGVFRLRETLEQPQVGELVRVYLSEFVVLIAVIGLSLLPLNWEAVTLLAWLQKALPPALCLSAIVGLLVLLVRLRLLRTDGTRSGAVNPWL